MNKVIENKSYAALKQLSKVREAINKSNLRLDIKIVVNGYSFGDEIEHKAELQYDFYRLSDVWDNFLQQLEKELSVIAIDEYEYYGGTLQLNGDVRSKFDVSDVSTSKVLI